MARYTILLFFTYFGVMRIWNFLSRSSIPGLQQSPPSRNFTDNNFLLVEWHCQICHTFDWVLKTGAYFLNSSFFFPTMLWKHITPSKERNWVSERNIPQHKISQFISVYISIYQWITNNSLLYPSYSTDFFKLFQWRTYLRTTPQNNC